MSNFYCKDDGVQSFLRNKAVEFDKRNVARTYLLFDTNRLFLNELALLAYFTVSIKPLTFSQTLSKNKVKQIDGFSKESESVGTILIGQLGKNSYYANDISGSAILAYAMAVVCKVFDITGGRIVLIECLPEEKLVSFYQSNGFVYLQENEDYLQLVRFL